MSEVHKTYEDQAKQNDEFWDSNSEWVGDYPLSRLLQTISREAAQGLGHGKVIDINGNTIGSWNLLKH